MPSNAPLSSSVESVHVDPDGLLSPSERDAFVSLLKEFQLVFDSRIPGYNGAAGPIEGVVNMGPVEPPQRKGRVPQYSRDQLDLLQTKFDELESQGCVPSTRRFKGRSGIFEPILFGEEEEWRLPLGHCLY